MFKRYVASVSHQCVAKVDRDIANKSKLGCCTCCNGYVHVFQVYTVPNVSYVSEVCCKCFHLDVVKVYI
jgi:hypothetical protein